MQNREELVNLARVESANIAFLARRFGVSRKTAYKWIRRGGAFDEKQTSWSRDRSRRPHHSPGRVGPEIELAALEVRAAHPAWGPRKILAVLARQDRWRETRLPAPSTVAAILRRRDLVSQEESRKRQAFVRFEREAANDLWQMDFKGDFATRGGKCHPLTLLDDHSRYAIGIEALSDEKTETTRQALVAIFRRHGLPEELVVDNGSCWGRSEGIYSAFTVWLVRLGMRVIFSRPFHPQTRGKDERFHRTLDDEVIHGRQFASLEQCQHAFDLFRDLYNAERPHEALGMAVPASRYKPSQRSYPEQLPPIEYLEKDLVVAVRASGMMIVAHERYQIGRAFAGQPLALRPTPTDGVYDLFYCRQRIAVVDRRDATLRAT